jgi:hypothetical protein
VRREVAAGQALKEIWTATEITNSRRDCGGGKAGELVWYEP